MPDFLEQMGRASRERCAAARANLPEHLLRQRAAMAAPVQPLPAGFLLIAEVKRISPAAGPLAASDLNIQDQARRYAAGGAGVISILTEPMRFGGSLADLQQIAQTLPLPVMRKDFLVDPYQVLEARASSASGILLIIKMLDDHSLLELLAASNELGMFTLVEAFDRDDLDRCATLLPRTPFDHSRIFLGLNTRDLRTLNIAPDRLERLAGAFPPEYRRIAESGLDTPEDVARAAAFGYDGALVGSALMRAADPAALCRAMHTAGTAAIAATRSHPSRSTA